MAIATIKTEQPYGFKEKLKQKLKAAGQNSVIAVKKGARMAGEAAYQGVKNYAAEQRQISTAEKRDKHNITAGRRQRRGLNDEFHPAVYCVGNNHNDLCIRRSR
jgi:hypothetical protein